MKTKIIISLLFSTSLLWNFFAGADLQVELRILDDEGAELQQVQIGKPFTLEVVASGSNGVGSEPQIEGTDKFNVRRVGRQISMMNGAVSSARYRHEARIDKPGSYSIGPAVVSDEGQHAQSDVLIVKVGNHEIADRDVLCKQQKEMFLELAVDDNDVVVGQRIDGTLSFYYAVPVSQLQGLACPNIDGFAIDEKSMRKGVQEVDGKQYNCAVWDWHLFPKDPGSIVIPSCNADVIVQSENHFSGYASFFSLQPERKRVHSNALTITVSPLPAHTQPVDAVGRFQNFDANVNQAAAREGDAVVVSLSIEGDADLENLNIELHDVPHVFKSYSSKQKIDDKKNDGRMAKKSFEYIVQGMEAGEWEIPEQRFTYYNVKTNSYETLKTAPLIVRILPSASAKKYVPPPPDASSVLTFIDAGDGTNVYEMPLNTNGDWFEVPERKMPWWLFMILFFAPLGMWLSGWLRHTVRNYFRWRAPKDRWRKAFIVARKKIEHAKKKRDFPALYRVFVELFAVRCSVKDPAVCEQMIQRVLKVSGFTEEKLKEWDSFFADVSAFVFYKVEGAESKKQLFDQAIKWVDVLEEAI